MDTLRRLVEQIDFDSERYYNLYFESAESVPPVDIGAEVWTNLSSLTADLNKLRGEFARMRHGVEQLRMPAIETVGLDRVAEQLRSLESRLRPLAEVLSQAKGDDEARRLLKDLMTVMDALDRVFELIEAQPGSVPEGVEKGLRSIYALLSEVLARHDLRQMSVAVGGEFDPRQHMAMGTEPHESFADGTISRVLLKGYMLGDQVFRTAQVVLVKSAVAGN